MKLPIFYGKKNIFLPLSHLFFCEIREKKEEQDWLFLYLNQIVILFGSLSQFLFQNFQLFILLNTFKIIKGTFGYFNGSAIFFLFFFQCNLRLYEKDGRTLTSTSREKCLRKKDTYELFSFMYENLFFFYIEG